MIITADYVLSVIKLGWLKNKRTSWLRKKIFLQKGMIRKWLNNSMAAIYDNPPNCARFPTLPVAVAKQEHFISHFCR